MTVDEAKPVYSWLQEDCSIVVSFELPAGTVKSDVEFQLSAGSLNVGLKDVGVLLSGDLYGKVDVDGSSWILTDNKLYVNLLGPFHGAIAVPSVTRCRRRWRRGHRCAGGARQYR